MRFSGLWVHLHAPYSWLTTIMCLGQSLGVSRNLKATWYQLFAKRTALASGYHFLTKRIINDHAGYIYMSQRSMFFLIRSVYAVKRERDKGGVNSSRKWPRPAWRNLWTDPHSQRTSPSKVPLWRPCYASQKYVFQPAKLNMTRNFA